MGVAMQVSQAQTTAVTLNSVPARLMAEVPPGRSVEAMVVRGGDNARATTLQVGNQFIRIDASQSLQPGQSVTLARASAGGPDSLQMTLNQPSSQGLRANQQIPVEVMERLANQRLLVRPAMLSTTAGSLPAEIEISTARLSMQPAVGERLTMTVSNTQPLSVMLSQQLPSRAEMLQQIQRLLLPLTSMQPPTLEALQAASGRNLPPTVQQSLQQLFQSITEARQLNGETGVRQALNNAGVFLENQLMQGADTSRDFKAALLKLAAALTQQLQQPQTASGAANRLPLEIRETLSQLFSQPQPMQRLTAQLGTGSGQALTQLLIQLLGGQTGNSQIAQNAAAMQQASQSQALRPDMLLMRDMLREVESTTARVQLNQLGMLRDAETPSQNATWLLDVPLKDKQQLDWLQLRFDDRRTSGHPEHEEQWQIDIRLDTHALGRVQAAVALTGEQVAVNVTAESAQAADILQQELPLLHGKLTELDLQVTGLDCEQAAVNFDSPVSSQHISSHMVDISV